MNTHPLLSSPARWGALQLPNRMFMPSITTRTANEDGTLSQRGHNYLLERARGGVGLLIAETMLVQDTYDTQTGHAAALSHDRHIEPLARLADAVHAEGARLAVNLTPGFGRIRDTAPDGGPAYSASTNTLLSNPNQRCRELSTTQVEDIIEKFGQAVTRAMHAGVDAIDIHAHSGYLIDQFLAAAWNKRDDKYGGTTAQRATFATELIRTTREIVGWHTPISMRIAVRHQFPGGRGEIEARELVLTLQDAGLDVMIVDSGSFESLNWAFPAYYMGNAPYLPDAATVKPPLTLPIAICGNLTPDVAEQALRDKLIDFAGFGRPLIADPLLPLKVANNDAHRVRPCIRCNQKCVGNLIAGIPISCAVNPAAARENELRIQPASTTKHVVVIGAGPAGLEAARVAARRGHSVDLYEQADQLGGVLAWGATPTFKDELRDLLSWWEQEIELEGVRVHLGHEVTANDPALEDADAIILALGAKPHRPELPGVNLPHVIDVVDAHKHGVDGHEIVICGGGLSGSDLALQLALDGHHVSIVEQSNTVGPHMLIHNRIALQEKLDAAGVRILTEHHVTRFAEECVELEGPHGPLSIPADTAVLAFGGTPCTTEVTRMKAQYPHANTIGDCVHPAMVAEAVDAAYRVALAV